MNQQGGPTPVSYNFLQDKETKKKPPIVITVVGNRISVACDDPTVLAEIQQTVRYLLESPGIHDFRVHQLENINAVDAAKILDEMFNGPKPTGGGGRGPGGGGRGPGGGGGAPTWAIPWT